MRYRIAILGCLVLLISPSMASAGLGNFATASPAVSALIGPGSRWPVLDALAAQVPVVEAEAACVPSVAAATSILDKNRGEVVAISVALQANATVAGGDKLARVSFTDVSNGVVEVNGVATTVPSIVALPPATQSWSFVLRKVALGSPFHLNYVVTDLCGDVPKFAGAGTGPQLDPTPTPTVTPQASATASPTATSTPVAAATAMPTKTPTPVPSPTPTNTVAASPTPTSSPTPISTGGASGGTASAPAKLSMFYHPPKDGTTLQTMVQRYASVVFTRGDEQYRDQMRAAGFSGSVLQYLMANEASGPPRVDKASGLRTNADTCDSQLEISYFLNNVSGIAGDFCTALHSDERNFLHNGRSERLYGTLSWQEMTGTKTVYIYQMNPAAPGWREYFARRAQENGKVLGYSGLFLDNVDLSLYRGQRQEANSDGLVTEYSSNSAYRDAVVGYLSTLRARVGSILIWANTTGAYDTPSDEDAYLPYLDGVMNEYFVDRWGGTYASGSVWESQVRQAEKVLAQDKGFLGVGQGTQTDTTRMRFAFASYLLVSRTGAYFRYADENAYEQAWLYSDEQARLGSPLGGRYQSGASWRRDFACGYVTVDVTNKAGTIATDPTRPGCS